MGVEWWATVGLVVAVPGVWAPDQTVGDPWEFQSW